MIRQWNIIQNEIAPLEVMFPADTTFVVEINQMPALSACLYLTNSPWFVHVEHLIGNPALSGDERRQALKAGLEYIEEYARRLGYHNLYCVTQPEKLKKYYESLGFEKTVDGAAAFIKPLGRGSK